MIAAGLESVPLLANRTLAVVDFVAAVAACLLLIRPRRRRRWWLVVVIALVVGACVGGLLAWYVGDVQNLVGVSPTWVDRIWTGAVVAGVFLAFVNLAVGRWWKRLIAIPAIAVFVLAGALAVNHDAGQYATAGQLLGTTAAPDMSLPTPLLGSGHLPLVDLGAEFNPRLYATWRRPLGMPAVGRVGQVTIPATVSHFTARQAWVYLPPAALVKSAPALPVVILMSGQPANPGTVMVSGNVPATLDALAAKNNGLAPIVVVPDQLGPAEGNPMCVDGPSGNSKTYLTVDVPNWIRTHLHVERNRLAWAVGGFSQGATCALQFGTGDPGLFGSFIDVSGEEYPTEQTDAQAIADQFGGSVAAYDAAKPLNVMKAHGRYLNTSAYFAVGADDSRYGPVMPVVSEAARKVGIHVITDVFVGSGHDWTTATKGFAQGIGDLYPRLGLARTRQSS